jgi:hypothetical protein
MKKIWMVGLVWALFFLGPNEAEARRGLAIINTGENVTHVADVKADLKADLEARTAPGVQIGILHSRFGVFWLDIWRWNKRFCLYTDNEVWESTAEELQEFTDEKVKAPFTMTVPPGLIILGVLGVGFIGLTIMGAGMSDEEDAPPVANDLSDDDSSE